MRPTLGPFLHVVALVAVIAALTHLVTILILPEFATHDAYARVSALGDPFRTLPLPTASPDGAAFPFSDPATASAVCRYDLGQGPVRARAPLGGAIFASLSFHSRRGAAFYALNDRAATKGRMEALIVTTEQLRQLVARDDEDNPTEDLRIVSPTKQGFVIARVLSATPDALPAAAEQAGAMTCAPEPIAEAER